MQERETRLPPETAPLKQGETFIFAGPDITQSPARINGALDVYNKCIVPTNTGLPVFVEGADFTEHVSEIYEALRLIKSDPKAATVFASKIFEVFCEYQFTLDALSNIVGKDRIMLVADRRAAELTDGLLAKGMDESTLYSKYPQFDLLYSGNGLSMAYPRDVATTYDNRLFIAPSVLTDYQGEGFDRKSLLSEGGAVLNSGDVVLLSEKLRNTDPTAEAQRNMLRQLGYKVAWFPGCDPEKQPRGKKAIVAGHIDSHASLVEGKDGEQNLLVARSFFEQSSPTKEKVKRASDFTGAHLVVIEDSDLPHLAFNLIQFRNGVIAISQTGKEGGTEYIPSTLETALDGIVGPEKVIVLPPLRNIPQRTQAGIRCMSNILPTEFILKAKEATGQK